MISISLSRMKRLDSTQQHIKKPNSVQLPSNKLTEINQYKKKKNRTARPKIESQSGKGISIWNGSTKTTTCRQTLVWSVPAMSTAVGSSAPACLHHVVWKPSRLRLRRSTRPKTPPAFTRPLAQVARRSLASTRSPPPPVHERMSVALPLPPQPTRQ